MRRGVLEANDLKLAVVGLDMRCGVKHCRNIQKDRVHDEGSTTGRRGWWLDHRDFSILAGGRSLLAVSKREQATRS